MTNVNVAQVRRDFLAECQDDYVSLGSLIERVRRSLAMDENKIHVVTLELLAELLSANKIIAGQFDVPRPDAYEFHEWPIPPDEVIERIDREWQGLGRDPHYGEIAWFTATQLIIQSRNSKDEVTGV